MATSPLFGWEEPDDTDLVKDGAAAIRTLGNAIDTSMGDLLGGTSGQVLSKNSNTNMDFTWVTSDDANAIQNAIVDAKGDLITATAADTPARLAVGTNGQTLVADSTAATGLKWATPASGSTFAGCRIFMTAATTSIANSTLTTVSFDTEEYDTDGFHSNVTNPSRITIPAGKAGYYLIIATTDFAQNSTGARGNSIKINGTEKGYTAITPNTTEGAAYGNSVIVSLSVGDYIEMQVRQTSGGALDLRGSSVAETNLIAAYLGA